MAGLSHSKDESKSTDTDKVKFLETVIFLFLFPLK